MLFFSCMLTGFMLLVMFYDLTRYLIPNWLVGTILGLYPAMVLMSPVPVAWQGAVLVMLAAFAVGFVLYTLKVMGAGDIKLIMACSLWTGQAATLDFLVYTGLLGGVLSLVLWLARPGLGWMVARMKNPPALPRLLMVGEPAPYGLAIAAAFLILLWSGKIPATPSPLNF